MSKAHATLSILGHHVGTAGDDLNLTDMWRAAGSDPDRRPAEWQRSTQGSAFISFIAGNLNMGNTHIIRTEKGRGGATWGHWQIGLAYAQYLSPRFGSMPPAMPSCARTWKVGARIRKSALAT
jgi:hypothetical protein